MCSGRRWLSPRRVRNGHDTHGVQARGAIDVRVGLDRAQARLRKSTSAPSRSCAPSCSRRSSSWSRSAPSSTVILVTGMDGAGKSEVIHKLLEWLDPRHVRVAAYGDTGRHRADPAPDVALLARPAAARRDLASCSAPGTAIRCASGWPADRGKARFERELAAINRFEEMLTSEGVLLLKFLLVVSAKEQKRRLDALAKRTGGASRALEEWAGSQAAASRRAPMVEEMVRRTSTGDAPWIVLPCDDPEYRDLAFGRAVLAGLRGACEATPPTPARGAGSHPQCRPPQPARRPRPEPGPGQVATTASGSRRRRSKLLGLSQRKAFRDRALVAAFEGHDAAGKGGAIRRVTMALDPRQYRVYPVAAPTDEEKGRPYLWRFWRHVPRQGRIAIFDRSWYGRVLVERVEGFASPAEWRRAYGEINDFEEELGQAGIVVAKFWLAISKDEQLRRFEARADTRVQAVQDHARGLAQPREMGPLPRRHRRDDRPHQHARRALDPGRGAGQALGAGQGPGDTGRAARGRALSRRSKPASARDVERGDVPRAAARRAPGGRWPHPGR